MEAGHAKYGLRRVATRCDKLGANRILLRHVVVQERAGSGPPILHAAEGGSSAKQTALSREHGDASAAAGSVAP